MPQANSRRLRIWTFKVYGDYAEGVIVVGAYSLKSAQKQAFEKEFDGINKVQQSTYDVYKPEDLTEYKESEFKFGHIASLLYAI